MTKRPIIASILLLQLSIGPQAFAVDPEDAPAAPTQVAPAAPEKKACSKLAASCLEKNYLTFVFSQAEDCETVQRINDEYKKPGGGKCNLDKKFRKELVDLWKERSQTEAGIAAGYAKCEKCLKKAENSLTETVENGAKIKKQAEADRDKTGGGGDPAPPVIHNKEGDEPAPQRRQPQPQQYVEEPAPAQVARPSHREVEPEPVAGGGGGFMGSPAMWGLGGLAVGGILGYMIGKNSAQQQPYYNYNPYSVMGPQQFGGPGFGQVPQRPGLPPFYRAPMGGFPGGGTGAFPYNPYAQGGMNGGYGVGGYGAGGYPGAGGYGGYGLGVNYGQGFNTGAFGNTIYNGGGGGQAPVYLPMPGSYR